MNFELSILIRRPPEEVFRFLRDKDSYQQAPGSPVLVLEKTTPGPVCRGTRYREVVQMLPFVRGEILSVITHYEPGVRLEEDFEGAGMSGHLAYRFTPENGGTRLEQREMVQTQGFLRLLSPIIKQMLARRLWQRLEDIRDVLEN